MHQADDTSFGPTQTPYRKGVGSRDFYRLTEAFIEESASTGPLWITFCFQTNEKTEMFCCSRFSIKQIEVMYMTVRCGKCTHMVRIGGIQELYYECKLFRIEVERDSLVKCPGYMRKPRPFTKIEPREADEATIRSYLEERIP